MQDTTTIQLHPQQLEAFRFTTPYGAAICGKRSGKTFVGALWVGKKLTELHASTGLICAPTVKLLHQAALDTFFDIYPEIRKFWNKGDGTIILPDGTTIYLRSGDDPNAIEGMTLDWAWLDEGGLMKPEIWLKVRARVSTRKGQVFITTSSYDMNWLYDEVFLPWERKEDEDISVFRWPTGDNPLFKFDEEAKKFLEKERKRLTPELFAREYEGQFVKLEGLIYKDFNRKYHVKPAWLPNPGEIVFRAMDFGAHNPTVCLWVHVNNAGEVIVFDEYVESERTTSYHAGVILSRYPEFAYAQSYVDPSGKQEILDYAQFGLFLTPALKIYPREDDWVISGINEIQTLLKVNPTNGRPKLFITENCKVLLDEIESYRWHPRPKVAERDQKDIPMKVNDHCVDALRYFAVSYRPTKGLRSTRRKVFEETRERSPITGY